MQLYSASQFLAYEKSTQIGGAIAPLNETLSALALSIQTPSGLPRLQFVALVPMSTESVRSDTAHMHCFCYCTKSYSRSGRFSHF